MRLLPPNPLRLRMDSVMRGADNVRPSTVDDYLVTEYGKIPGITVLERGRWLYDIGSFTCFHYALGDRLGLSWARRGQELFGESFSGMARFLIEKGFQEIESPEPGSLAVYARQINDPLTGQAAPYEEHVGICEPDESVTSKIGSGPILNHPWTGVPMAYGDEVRFYSPPLPASL